MQSFTIITDSSADLSSDMVEQTGVKVVPLSFLMEKKVYKDWPDHRDMEPKVFYNSLREGKVATTNAVNVEDFNQEVEPLLAGGQDVLILAFSSGLSSTCQSAMLCAKELGEKYPQRQVAVVDTLCASMGQGLLVWNCARLWREGKSLEEVRQWAEENKMNICHQITVDDLQFLKRGGRISATTALMGGMLSIKPIICVDHEGRLVNVAKARGRAAALKALVDRMEQTAHDPENQTAFIAHGDCLEDAQSVADMIRQRMGTRDIQINYIGPVIGAHTGPDVMTLFYMGSPR